MLIFSVRLCLVSRLSRRVGGVPRALGLSFLVVGAVWAGQPGAYSCRRVIAAVIWLAQGQVAAVLALGDLERRIGHYGYGGGASSIVPPVAQP